MEDKAQFAGQNKVRYWTAVQQALLLKLLEALLQTVLAEDQPSTFDDILSQSVHCFAAVFPGTVPSADSNYTAVSKYWSMVVKLVRETSSLDAVTTTVNSVDLCPMTSLTKPVADVFAASQALCLLPPPCLGHSLDVWKPLLCRHFAVILCRNLKG